jgi:uncharacterized membrane protein YesL
MLMLIWLMVPFLLVFPVVASYEQGNIQVFNLSLGLIRL